MREEYLDLHAGNQYGLVTSDELQEHLGTSTMRRAVCRGRVRPVRRGIYRMQGVPPSWEQSLAAVLLALRSGTVASHRAAARLWGLMNDSDDTLEVSIAPQHFARVTGVVSHRSICGLSHATVHQGIPVTTVARTVIDLAQVLHRYQVEAILDEALRKRLTTLKEVADCFEEVRRPGRPRCGVFAKILSQRMEHRTESGLERKVLSWIKNSRLPVPRAQFNVNVKGHVYRLDFAWPDQKVAVEPAGFHFHNTRTSFDRDAQRLAQLTSVGWTILPVTTATTKASFLDNLKSVLRPRK